MKYFHYNHLGDVALATGADAQSVALMPVLENIGLRLYGPRLYDGDLGRFLMPDAIIPNLYEPQSMNPYSYCHNDPVNYIDPSGHYRRVPRIFPYGEMPAPGANLLVGGLQVVSTIVGAAVSLGCFGNVSAGIAVAMAFDIVLNALVPAILAHDNATLTRGEIIKRMLVDITMHGVAAGAGFFAQKGVFARTRGFNGRLISILVANSGMVVGGLWSSQLGGLMKSFGMGYDLGLSVHYIKHPSRPRRHKHDHLDQQPARRNGAPQQPKGWYDWGSECLDDCKDWMWQTAAWTRDKFCARPAPEELERQAALVEQALDASKPLLQPPDAYGTATDTSTTTTTTTTATSSTGGLSERLRSAAEAVGGWWHSRRGTSQAGTESQQLLPQQSSTTTASASQPPPPQPQQQQQQLAATQQQDDDE